MRKYAFLYALFIVLLVPTMHAMESTINPNSFTLYSKEYMRRGVNMWAETARAINVTTGLASILNDIKKVGIDELINDKKVLERANKIYKEMDDESKNNLLHSIAMRMCVRIIYLGEYKYLDDIKQIDYQENLLVSMGCPVEITFDKISFSAKAWLGISDDCLDDYVVEQTAKFKALLLIAGHLVQTEEQYNQFSTILF